MGKKYHAILCILTILIGLIVVILGNVYAFLSYNWRPGYVAFMLDPIGIYIFPSIFIIFGICIVWEGIKELKTSKNSK